MRVGHETKDIMARFEKTRIHWVSAVLGLLALYAFAGFGYAAYAGSGDSIAIWAIVGVVALVASFVTQKVLRGAKTPS
jgi:fatty acid desaturase